MERPPGASAPPFVKKNVSMSPGVSSASLAPRRARGSVAMNGFAYASVAQLFDHPSPPDLCVIHSSAHNLEDQGGHRGTEDDGTITGQMRVCGM